MADRVEARSVADGARTVVLVLVGLALVGGVVVAYALAASVSRPLQSVAAAIGELSEGNSTIAVSGAERKDEVGVMAKAVQCSRTDDPGRTGWRPSKKRGRAGAT